MPQQIIEALDIRLYDKQVAIQTHYAGSRNHLVFSPDYITIPSNRQETLAQLAGKNYFEQVRSYQLRLDPVQSNLLPEGSLREWMAKQLKIHIDDEFALLACTGGTCLVRFLPFLWLHKIFQIGLCQKTAVRNQSLSRLAGTSYISH